MKKKLTVYDPAEDLGTDESIAVFLADALESGDAGYVAHAHGVAARAREKSRLSSERPGTLSAQQEIPH